MNDIDELIYDHRQAAIDWYKAWVEAYGSIPNRGPSPEQSDELNDAIKHCEGIERRLNKLLRNPK